MKKRLLVGMTEQYFTVCYRVTKQSTVRVFTVNICHLALWGPGKATSRPMIITCPILKAITGVSTHQFIYLPGTAGRWVPITPINLHHQAATEPIMTLYSGYKVVVNDHAYLTFAGQGTICPYTGDTTDALRLLMPRLRSRAMVPTGHPGHNFANRA